MSHENRPPSSRTILSRRSAATSSTIKTTLGRSNMRATVGCTIALLSCLSVRAEAGRSHFGWRFGTELNPNRGVDDRHDLAGSHAQ